MFWLLEFSLLKLWISWTYEVANCQLSTFCWCTNLSGKQMAPVGPPCPVKQVLLPSLSLRLRTPWCCRNERIAWTDWIPGLDQDWFWPHVALQPQGMAKECDNVHYRIWSRGTQILMITHQLWKQMHQEQSKELCVRYQVVLDEPGVQIHLASGFFMCAFWMVSQKHILKSVLVCTQIGTCIWVG